MAAIRRVFAEQIVAYLKESAAERALMVDDIDEDVQALEPQSRARNSDGATSGGAGAHLAASTRRRCTSPTCRCTSPR